MLVRLATWTFAPKQSPRPPRGPWSRIAAVLVASGGLLLGAGPGLAAETTAGGDVSVAVSGAGVEPRTFAARELAALPRLEVEAEDHGVRGRFEGVALSELLARAGTPLGEKLRGSGLALVLVVEAADGYRALFALPELDPAFTDKVVILADRRDGRPLAAGEGPLRIVAVGEKRQARWVRQVTALRLVTVAEALRAGGDAGGH